VSLGFGKSPLVQDAIGVEVAMYVVVSELTNGIGTICLSRTLACETFADFAVAFAAHEGAVAGNGDYFRGSGEGEGKTGGEE